MQFWHFSFLHEACMLSVSHKKVLIKRQRVTWSPTVSALSFALSVSASHCWHLIFYLCQHDLYLWFLDYLGIIILISLWGHRQLHLGPTWFRNYAYSLFYNLLYYSNTLTRLVHGSIHHRKLNRTELENNSLQAKQNWKIVCLNQIKLFLWFHALYSKI